MKKLFICILVLSCFCAYAAESEGVKAVILAKSPTSWNGANLPEYPKGEPEISILKITIPAGAVLPFHKHPVINAGVLLSGELTVVTKEGDTLVLHAGDPIIEVVNTWHKGENTGIEPAEIIVFYAGTKGAELSILSDR